MKTLRFQEMINIHQPIVHKICMIYCDHKQDQEDLFQDIIFQLWRSFDGFRNEAKVSTWIYKIALNTALGNFRKKRVAIEYHEDIPDRFEALSENMSSLDQLIFLMRKLSDVEKALLSLYLEGYSHQEIGEILGSSENNTAVKINRLKVKLKKIAEK